MPLSKLWGPWLMAQLVYQPGAGNPIETDGYLILVYCTPLLSALILNSPPPHTPDPKLPPPPPNWNKFWLWGMCQGPSSNIYNTSVYNLYLFFFPTSAWSRVSFQQLSLFDTSGSRSGKSCSQHAQTHAVSRKLLTRTLVKICAYHLFCITDAV